jgi:chlorophyllide a reductase subunit Z
VLVQISAAKALRDRAEQEARAAGEPRVTAERVARSGAALKLGEPA